ncbi:bifunctional diguanylate cyclase/phosphodiesterase [Simplicispira psychrophila]|uniref:bifunctional diguanylate cyclase/phosphodiesterase n=1 Tax=Simplicispira psychrophila TaxID=80882 RepID=UPI001FDF45B2|nr:EAL domain-containing protein [Simplicispira psychrophila]
MLWGWPMLVACALTLSMLGITFLYWQAQERQSADKVSRDFQHAVDNIVYNIQGRIDAYELVLRGVKGFFDSSEDISQKEFQTYIDTLHLEDKKPGLQGVSMIRSLDSAEKDALLLPIWPTGTRTHYAPIVYIEPLTAENQKIVGFDIATRPKAWEALERARDGGEPAITRKLVLAQDVGDDNNPARTTPGLVMYLPLYAPQTRLDTLVQRRAALRGWVSVQFRMQAMMHGLIEKLDSDIDLHIYDGEVLNAKELLYSSLNTAPIGADPARPSTLHTTRQLLLGGHLWTLLLQPRPAFIAHHASTQHAWVAAMAVAGSLMLGWLAWLLMTGRERALILARDMTHELRHTRDDLVSTLNAVPDLLFELDLQGRIHRFRFARVDLLQGQPEQFAGKCLADIMSPDAAAGSMAALKEAWVTGYSGGQEYGLELAGEHKWFELSVARKEGGSSSAGPRFIALSRDITERKKAQAHTLQLAYYDTLTGLPNRALLQERLHNALTAHQRLGEVGALIFLDLDNFKQINDARGHAVGDALLIQVAQRLMQQLRSGDTVARLGGDEFVVLLQHLASDMQTAAAAALRIAEQIHSALEVPHQIDTHLYSSSASMGITLFPKNVEGADDLLREADTAMCQAKKMEHNRLCFFEAAMLTDAQESLALAQDVKAAMERGEISVYAQSQVNAHSTAVVGGELLLRWNHPLRGNVSPDRFISVAEDSGLILRLGEWVIVQACETLARLQATHPALTLSVNVSPRQFHQDDFVDRIRAILLQTGAPATQLILEITETLLVNNLATIGRMTELVQIGIRFSIDDFGTGYSSLSYLKKLPLFELKIDKSFVQDIPDDVNDTAIVQAILAVAQHLKLRVVAEGVETQAQADFLRAHHCNDLQGFLFERPMLLESWLAQQLHSGA